MWGTCGRLTRRTEPKAELHDNVVCMRTASVLILLAASCGAQTFKGHHIGESVSEFLVAEPELKAKLEGCVNDTPKELNPEEIRQQFGKKGAKEYEQKMASAPAGSHVSIYATNPEFYRDRCEALILTLRDGNGSIDGTGYSEGNPHEAAITAMMIGDSDHDRNLAIRAESARDQWRGSKIPRREYRFSAGQLVWFFYDMYDVSYEVLAFDLLQRVGAAGHETLTPMHNVYGATWNNASQDWLTADIHIHLYEDRNPAKRLPIGLVVETRKSYEERLKQLANRKSSLD